MRARARIPRARSEAAPRPPVGEGGAGRSGPAENAFPTSRPRAVEGPPYPNA